jgi:ribonuclease HI
MPTNWPHYLLFAEASGESPARCSWRFSLEHVGSSYGFSASDWEPDCPLERLELLAVVRGLEAIDCPARVTLVTKSRYVGRGLRRGLAEWRANDWRWERFGQLTSVRDADLWKRIDTALQFHQVDCRVWKSPHRRSVRTGSHTGTVSVTTARRRRGSRLPISRRTVLAGSGLAAG